MPLLTSSSVTQIQTILDLYPISVLKDKWDVKGIKDDLCLEIAGTRGRKEIAEFVHENFNICKQHIYIFNNESGLEQALDVSVTEMELIAESVTENAVIKTFLTKHQIEVVILTEQIQRSSVEFILPLQIIYSEDYVQLRFVTFERNYHTFYKGLEVLPLKKKDEREAEMVKLNKRKNSPCSLFVLFSIAFHTPSDLTYPKLECRRIRL